MEWVALSLDLVHIALVFMIWRDLRNWWEGGSSSADETIQDVLGEP